MCKEKDRRINEKIEERAIAMRKYDAAVIRSFGYDTPWETDERVMRALIAKAHNELGDEYSWGQNNAEPEEPAAVEITPEQMTAEYRLMEAARQGRQPEPSRLETSTA